MRVLVKRVSQLAPPKEIGGVSLRVTVMALALLAALLAAVSPLGAGRASAASLAPLATIGEDWPTFLHDPQRTSASGETILSPANASQLTKQWSYKTGGVVAASPTIVAGVVYVGSWDGYEYALDAATGALKWKTYLGVTTADPICNPPKAGVSSAPTVQNGVVYLGGGDDYWYALDATTGAALWQVYVGDSTATGGNYNWASPLIYNGYAYIGVASMGDCPLVQGKLMQVSLTTHQVVNTFKTVPDGQVGGGIWTTPSINPATNTIYVTTGTEATTTQQYAQAFLALDASTLALKDSWKVPETQTVSDSDFGTTPVLFTTTAGNQMVAATNKNGVLYAFNQNSLAAGPVWQQQLVIGGDCPLCGASAVSSLAFGANTLFAAGGESFINGQGSKGSVSALDPATGAFRWRHSTSGNVIAALAYVNGLVLDGAGSTLEALDASSGARLYSYTTGGALYAAPSVSHGVIYTGGVDGSVYALALPATPPPAPPADANCPNGWVCQDIGSPAPGGSETVNGGVWTVNAGGAGAGGQSDQFRFLSTGLTGAAQISAQLNSFQPAGTAPQGGLMVRQSADPGSPYYALLLAPNNTLTVQYRPRFGDTTTVANQVTTGNAPLYLEIQRLGDTFQAATSTDGVHYTLVPGATVTLVLPDLALTGLAASSGASGASDAITFSAVTTGAPSNTPAPQPSPSPCPTAWNCADVGDPALVGDQTLNNGTWTVKGAGSDIGSSWNGWSDQFHFVWQSLAADGALAAHITAQTNTDASAKAGVMLRMSAAADAAYYAAFVTPGSGILVQYRDGKGLSAQSVVRPSGAAPIYLQIARAGNTLSTYTSTDGTHWTFALGSSVTTNALTGQALAGLAVTSRSVSTMGSATFDSVALATTAPPPPSTCPSGWSCANIDNATPAGSLAYNNGTWTIQGGGGDIWGTSDQFYFVSQSLAGDSSVATRLTSQTNTNAWAKAGVMIRGANISSTPYYAALITPGNGVVVQYRSASGVSAQQLAQITAAPPAYLKVARTGSSFTAYTSTDGTTWTAIAGSTVTINALGIGGLGGLAVTSHDGANLSTVTFDTVSVSGAQSSTPGCPTWWNCADIGSPALAGTQSLTNGVWSVQGAGGDIWGTADQFHYVWQTLAGDGGVSAHVTAQGNTDPWAKAGVMLRASTDPGAPYYAFYVTPGNGVVVQYRATAGAQAQMPVQQTGATPVYLKVARAGTTFTAYTSPDGVTWTAVAGSTITLANLGGALLGGLAVTSHNAQQLSTVTADTLSVNAPAAAPGCPTGWSCADLGAPAVAGGQSVANGVWTVQGAGGDIWGTADQFHYIWQTLPGDGGVSAHVASQTNTDPWAKAGVMLRASTDAGSPYYAALVTPGNGVIVQYRSAAGAQAQTQAQQAGTVPAYLKVVRAGATFTAYTSTDGATWTPIVGSTITLANLGGSLLGGLAVTSHNAQQLSTVTADGVGVAVISQAQANCPSGWSCDDLGGPAVAGGQSVANGVWTVQGAGGDIWGTADQFHSVYQTLPGDGGVSAHVTSQTNTDPWAKAGVMLRANGAGGSPFYAAFITPGNGLVVQYRDTSGAQAQMLVQQTGATPVYLKVARAGTAFTAYTSPDGVTWTAVAGSTHTMTNMGGSLLKGVAVTSHNAGTASTVAFDTVQ